MAATKLNRGQARESSNRIVHTSFDAATHLPIKRRRMGPGRQGKLTEKGLETLKEVKRTGGQCDRCNRLKKRVSSPCPGIRVLRFPLHLLFCASSMSFGAHVNLYGNSE